MEKSSEAQRRNIKKASDVRQINDLMCAGFTAEQLEGMDRPARMAAIVELLWQARKRKLMR